MARAGVLALVALLCTLCLLRSSAVRVWRSSGSAEESANRDKVLGSMHKPVCEEMNLTDSLEPDELALYEELTLNATFAFSEEEVDAAHAEAGINEATCQQEPVAFYFLGPSAVGKTTVTNAMWEKYGIPARQVNGSEATQKYPDAVILDGDIWRDHHAGYSALASFGLKHGCIFKGAWDGVSEHSKKQKRTLNDLASSKTCRKNLLIPETCSTLSRCTSQVAMLKIAGYIVNVVSIYAPKVDVTERGMDRADKEGKYFTSTFDTPVAAFVPVMSMATGSCQFVNNAVSPWKISGPFACANQNEYNPFNAMPVLLDGLTDVLNVSGMTGEELQAAQETSNISDASFVAKSICTHAASLCPEGHAPTLRSLTVNSVGGAEMFFGNVTGGTSSKEIIVKSLREYEEDFWRTHFEALGAGSGHIVPYKAVWSDFGIVWSVQPNCLLPGGEVYDIKGVPSLRYFRKTGNGRDPNWVADFSMSREPQASVGISQGVYTEQIPKLAADIDALSKANAIDYSALVGIYDTSRAAGPQGRSAAGKAAWPIYSFGKEKVKAMVFGGLIDYLENTTKLRPDRGELGDFMGGALHKSPGVYGCRLFFFVATQMLAPCHWPSEAECSSSGTLGGACIKPTACVTDFKEVLEEVFRPHEATVNPRNFEVTACEHWDETGSSLEEASAKLLAHVKRKL